VSIIRNAASGGNRERDCSDVREHLERREKRELLYSAKVKRVYLSRHDPKKRQEKRSSTRIEEEKGEKLKKGISKPVTFSLPLPTQRGANKKKGEQGPLFRKERGFRRLPIQRRLEGRGRDN